jgi:3-deoxy-manno-octulosonate cytidylyltransferase (CMP-KDO synthetase)
MDIADREQFLNPDTVKIIHNHQGQVLYTTRAPVPYCKGEFSVEHGAKRIYGIFAFRWKYLKAFTKMKETFLEQSESCDSNRILDSDFRQFIAPVPHRKSFSVDSPADIKLVEEHMKKDPFWGRY